MKYSLKIHAIQNGEIKMLVIIINGIDYEFSGNELISAEREAIEFLVKLAEIKEDF